MGLEVGEVGEADRTRRVGFSDRMRTTGSGSP